MSVFFVEVKMKGEFEVFRKEEFRMGGVENRSGYIQVNDFKMSVYTLAGSVVKGNPGSSVLDDWYATTEKQEKQKRSYLLTEEVRPGASRVICKRYFEGDLEPVIEYLDITALSHPEVVSNAVSYYGGRGFMDFVSKVGNFRLAVLATGKIMGEWIHRVKIPLVIDPIVSLPKAPLMGTWQGRPYYDSILLLNFQLPPEKVVMVDVEMIPGKAGKRGIPWCGAIVAKDGRKLIAVHLCYFVEGRDVVWDFMLDHPIKTLITLEEFRQKVLSFQKRGFHIYAKGYAMEAEVLSGVPVYQGWLRDHKLGDGRAAFEEKGGFIIHDLQCSQYRFLYQWYKNHPIVKNMIERYKVDYFKLEYSESAHVPVIECLIFLYHWESVTDFLYQLQGETLMHPKYRGVGGIYDQRYYRNMVQFDWKYDKRIASITWHEALWEKEKMGGPVMVALTRMVSQRNAILRLRDKDGIVDQLEKYQPHVLSSTNVFFGGGELRWRWILGKDPSDYQAYVRYEALPNWWLSMEEVKQYQSDYKIQGLEMRRVYQRDSAMLALYAYMLRNDDDIYANVEEQMKVLKECQECPDVALMVHRRGNVRRIPYVVNGGILLTNTYRKDPMEEGVSLSELEDMDRMGAYSVQIKPLIEWEEFAISQSVMTYPSIKWESIWDGICDIYPEDLEKALPEFDLIVPLVDGGSRNVWRLSDGRFVPIRMSHRKGTSLLAPPPKKWCDFKKWLVDLYPQVIGFKTKEELRCWYNS